MSNFVSLNTALSALRASQIGMDVTSHNISNANTSGYTRQRVTLSAAMPYMSSAGAMGTGVKVEDVSRMRDQFLDLRMYSSNSAMGFLETQTTLLERAEGLLGEPDFGISKELNEMWASFEELSLRPDDNSVRLTTMSALDALAGRIRSVASNIDNLGQDAQLQLQDALVRVNDQIRELASLNQTITSIQGSGSGAPNDLLDRRDLLVDELSRSLGATSTYDRDGTVRLSVNGMDLVSGARANTLALQPDNSLLHPSGATAVPGGKVLGLQQFIAPTGALATIRGNLNAFAAELTNQLNTQHALGFTTPAPPGVPAAGGPLYAVAAGQEALTITLALASPADLATAGNATGNRFDGSNMAALGALRTPPAGPVVDQMLRTVITDIGAQVASARRQTQAEGGINAAASQARRDHHAVSLDEEMVSLMTYQRTYEAAARMATAVDQALETLINRLGIVGR